MIPVALFLVALLALWLFIRIDARRAKDSKPAPLPKAVLDGGFTPGLAGQWMPYAGMAAAGALGAFDGFMNPSAPPFTGRGHAIHELLYAVFGPYGWCGACVVGAIFFGLQAVAKYEEGAAQRRKQNVAQ